MLSPPVGGVRIFETSNPVELKHTQKNEEALSVSCWPCTYEPANIRTRSVTTEKTKASNRIRPAFPFASLCATNAVRKRRNSTASAPMDGMGGVGISTCLCVHCLHLRQFQCFRSGGSRRAHVAPLDKRATATYHPTVPWYTAVFKSDIMKIFLFNTR